MEGFESASAPLRASWLGGFLPVRRHLRMPSRVL
jgi:hypothetical protein